MTRSGTTLAALVLSLLALPLLPTFAHAQTEEAQKKLELELYKLRGELTKTEDAQRAQVELQQAQAELAKLQAQIKLTQERIKALEASLAAMKAKGGEKPGDHIRVETRSPEVVIVLRKVGDHWEVVQQPAKPKEGILWRVEGKDGVYRVVPVEPGKEAPGWKIVPTPQVPGQPLPPIILPPKVGTPATPDNRIDNLERQLQQIMKELEALRKEMKQPGKTGTAPEEDSRRKRLEELKKSLPPGAKIEEKDGIQIITLPVEIAPLPKPGTPIEIEPKR
jgi:hypothetical protein